MRSFISRTVILHRESGSYVSRVESAATRALGTCRRLKLERLEDRIVLSTDVAFVELGAPAHDSAPFSSVEIDTTDEGVGHLPQFPAVPGGFDSDDPCSGAELIPVGTAVTISKVSGTSVDAAPFVFGTSDSLYFDFSLGNVGNQASGWFSVELVIEGGGIMVTAPYDFRLNPHQTFVWGDASVSNLPVGHYTARLLVDVSDDVAECDEGNNIYERTFTVGTPGRPDIVPIRVNTRNASGGPIYTTDEVVVEVEIQNVGSAPVNSLDVELSLDDVPIDPNTTLPGPIDPGAIVQFEVNIGVLSEGTHQIRVFVDPPEPIGKHSEFNELNNDLYGRFTVISRNDSDLTYAVTDGWDGPIVVSTSLNTHTDDFPILTIDDNVYIDAGVGNSGTSPSGPFSIEVKLDGRGVETLRRDSILQVGEFAADFVDIELGQLAAGVHTVEVVIDPTNEVDEIDENNNRFMRRVQVLAPATLSGTKWHDHNSNGIRDGGEEGLDGWQIYIDTNENGQLDAGEPKTFTIADDTDTPEDESGRYAFQGLRPGTYAVAEESQLGWQQTLPGPELGLQTTFDIDIRFTDASLTAEEQSIIIAAADRWEEIIIGDLADHYTSVPLAGQTPWPDVDISGLFVDDLVIDVRAETIDGTPTAGKNTLGEGSPVSGNGLDRSDGTMLPTRGVLRIDADDLQQMPDAELFSVAAHEIGHVLGIGTLWDDLGLLDDSSPDGWRFVGATAAEEFAAIFVNAAQSVPVENADRAHWRETTFEAENMTPLTDAHDDPISRVTVGSLADLGYTVDFNRADAYAPPGAARPTIQIEATDGLIVEGETDTGEFTVTRTGPTDSELLVSFSISGTAGVSDIEPLPGHVAIPPGESMVAVQVAASDDEDVELSETVVLTLEGDAAYVIGSPRNTTLRIVDNEPADFTGVFTHRVTVRPGEDRSDVDFAGRNDAPTVIIHDVTPDHRASGVSEINVEFSERVTGFDLSDLELVRSTVNGVSVDLTAATLSSSDDINWVLGNLPALTADSGIYQLTLSATDSGIQDLGGIDLAIGDAARWTNGAGDADESNSFDQFDMILVLGRAKYRSGETATWREGDWTGDGIFDQFDIIAAQRTQPPHYLRGPFAAQRRLTDAIARSIEVSDAPSAEEVDAVDAVFAEMTH